MNSVEVTGVGVVERMREVNITVTADTNAVSGANVMMQEAAGIQVLQYLILTEMRME